MKNMPFLGRRIGNKTPVCGFERDFIHPGE
jgi:hypothetical protein